MSRSLKISLPKPMRDLFDGPAEYRAAHGGRGSGKTRGFAKMAAIRAVQYASEGKTGLILCAREFQNSLDDSSMAEIKGAIRDEPDLEPLFDIGEKYIRTIDKRIEFKFVGLRHNTESLKSKSRILICWIDEAEPVAQMVWDKLLPTIREEGSEIWISWNPESENSPTDKMFRQNPPPTCKTVEVNWKDNPWFPKRLQSQMEWDRQRDPSKFQWVWQGGYRKQSDALVFNNWKVEHFDTPENVDRFYFGGDWGYAKDPSVLVRMFLDGRTLYIDHEAYAVGCEIDYLPALFAGSCPENVARDVSMAWTNPYNEAGVPGAYEWPIIADSARPETISYMRRKGFNIQAARKGAGSVDEGVEFIKSHDVVIHPRCKHTAQEFAVYSYKTDPRTDEVLPVLTDKDNHVIDSVRYALESTRRAAHNALPEGFMLGGDSAPIIGGLGRGY
jgi:phage terminase large subunit